MVFEASSHSLSDDFHNAMSYNKYETAANRLNHLATHHFQAMSNFQLRREEASRRKRELESPSRLIPLCFS